VLVVYSVQFIFEQLMGMDTNGLLCELCSIWDMGGTKKIVEGEMGHMGRVGVEGEGEWSYMQAANLYIVHMLVGSVDYWLHM
jgi:hypothetical protein